MQERMIIATISQTFWPGITILLFIFPEHLQASVPQSTLWETMTFIHKLNLAYETGFVLGVNCFREIRFIINHIAERDFVKFTFMSLIVTVSSVQ